MDRDNSIYDDAAEYLAEREALLARLAKAEAERDAFAQHHGGHRPTCGGMNTAAGYCECGYLDGQVYREIAAERDAAIARCEKAEAIAKRDGELVGELRAAFDRLTDDERSVFPLNVQPDARPRVRLAHIEAGENAKAGQGTAVVSVPSKYERLAWFMACAANEALSRIDARKGE